MREEIEIPEKKKCVCLAFFFFQKLDRSIFFFSKHHVIVGKYPVKQSTELMCYYVLTRTWPHALRERERERPSFYVAA